MSNLFKSNSRFSCLIDEITPVKKDNKKKEIKEVKDKKRGEEKFNSFKRIDDSFKRRIDSFKPLSEKDMEKYRIEREMQEKIKKEMEDREIEIRNKKMLCMDYFPELNSVKRDIKNGDKNDENKKNSYIDVIKNPENIDNNKTNIDQDLVNLKPGWILFKRDPITRQTITKTHPAEQIGSFKKREKNDNEIANDIINALVLLHEKRTKDYIELYGYDTWEKMYKFPNWEEEENDIDEETETDIDEEELYDDY
jgi:hypothetical protein